MKHSLAMRIVACSVLAFILGCTTDNPLAGPSDVKAVPFSMHSALLDAPGLVSQAKAGRLGRGEQDLLVGLEDRLPGFGGLYIVNGEVQVYMKGSAAVPSVVQNVLSAVYASHKNPRVREAMASVGRARVLPATYSLSELVAIENRISSSPVPLPGWVAVGVLIEKNRVGVSFADSAALTHGMSVMGSIGVPLEALAPNIMAPVRLTATWESTQRPTRGGIRILIGNETQVPGAWGFDPKTHQYGYFYSYSGCSLGYNVRTPAGVDYLLTAGHCESMWRAINGVTGDTVFQGVFSRTQNIIATIVNNPAYHEGTACPMDARYRNKYFDYCTEADVMLGTYVSGVSGERTVGTSTWGGTGSNGRPGSADIRGFWDINGVLPPEYVNDTMHHDANKSGAATGTTSGHISYKMADIAVDMCWPLRAGGSCTVTKSIFLQKHAAADAVSDEGDSGGPVYTGNPGTGAPYAALGILVAGLHPPPAGPPPNPCLPEGNCTFIFARWDKIEPVLGVGPLLPQTRYP